MRQNAIVVESRMVKFGAVVKATRCPRLVHSWIIRSVLSEAGVMASQGYMMKQTFMRLFFKRFRAGESTAASERLFPPSRKIHMRG